MEVDVLAVSRYPGFADRLAANEELWTPGKPAGLWVPKLVIDDALGAAAQISYTVPAGKIALLTGVRAFNVSGGTSLLTIYLVPSGGAAGVTNRWWNAVSLGAGVAAGTGAFAVLSAGDTIQALSSVAGAINFSPVIHEAKAADLPNLVPLNLAGISSAADTLAYTCPANRYAVPWGAWGASLNVGCGIASVQGGVAGSLSMKASTDAGVTKPLLTSLSVGLNLGANLNPAIVPALEPGHRLYFTASAATALNIWAAYELLEV